jgi:hypothetical protein
MASAFAALRGADYASQIYAEQVNEHLRWLNKLEFKEGYRQRWPFTYATANAPP